MNTIFFKRSACLLLVLLMLVGMMPMAVLASGDDEAADNPWSGRSAVFVGDSITAGSGTTKTYYQFLEETLGFSSVTAMGVAGSCISAASDYGTSNQPLINRYQNIPSADLILVFMGTNDYGHETPLGTADDAQDGTFYGALNVIIPALVAAHSSSKIVFVTPLHRYGFGTSKILGTGFTYDSIPNGVGASLGDYVEALKTVCANNGVSVIDLYEECTLDPSDNEIRTNYMPDGLHPNAAGHELIAGIMESHIRNFEPVTEEPTVQTEMVYGNKFAAGNNQTCRASSRINYYLTAGTVITLKNPDVMQWACARTSNEYSSNNLGYFPDAQWTDKVTAVVEEDGWIGFTFKYRDENQTFDLNTPLSDYISIHTHSYVPVVTAPKGTIKGHTLYTCTGCSDSKQVPWVDASYYEGKTIACIGDSITAGVGVTKDENDYVTLLADQLGMDYIRLGVSGTTLCTDGSRTCNIGKLTETNLQGADIVTIAMGINDFCAAGAGYYELGDINSADSSTVYGAARMWCERIAELRKTDSLKNTQFYFVTPVICSWNNSVTSAHNWDQAKTNIHGYTLRDLCNAIIEMAELYDVAVIDLNLVSGMYYVDAQDNNTAVFGGDGVHPGATGHSMMANAMAHALLQNNLRNDHVHSYGSWITTAYPSCLNGKESRVCAVCTATESRQITARTDHQYVSEITVPTCTEQGYTTYTCACGDSYVSDYVDAAGHSYEKGICTVCNETHPNLANYKGKVISVLGDSISTFAGYIPVADGFNLEHLPRYPQADLLTDVNETWWMQVIGELDAKLGINDSWRGATVSGAAPVTTGTTGENAAMHNLTRIRNLGSNGTPDVILFYGGTNDLAHVSKVGTFDAASAPTEADLTTKKWDNLSDGYVHTLLRLRHYYPNATIIAMLPTYTKSYYTEDKLAQANAVLAQICEHYGVAYVDLRYCGITANDLPDGIHPGAAGMDYITDVVVDALLRNCKTGLGEHVVHSVTHKLTGVESTLGYYKGITHGESFVTTITGEDLTVSVTMGGADITDAVYENGVVSIPEVTGNLVITAEGRVKPIYEDHLQQLPETVCSGTDLWAVLEHDKQYYTATGWGAHSSGTVYSVTFPVNAGDRIYATSCGAAGTNGSSTNGIRVTWFDENGVLKSMGADAVYKEFSANGHLTAPEGAVAVSIPVWNINYDNELYLLTRDHIYENGICLSCGAAQPGPVITRQPADGEAKMGERYLVEVIAEGENLKYQWYFRNKGAKVWSKSSVRDNTYDDVMTTARAGREVYCVITDADGISVTTDTVKLVCLPSEQLAIITQPVNGEAVFGERYCVTVQAVGDGLKYQWYFRNSGAKDWTISSVKDNTYDDVMTAARHGREVYCVITDLFGNSVTSDVVSLIAIPSAELSIVTQPVDGEAKMGERYCVTVEAVGDGLKYQWYFRNSGAKDWTISSVKDNTYDDVMTAARANREVYCVITDAFGNSVTSDTVKLICSPTALAITTQPEDAEAVFGDRYCVTVEATGDGLKYQWYYRNAGSKDWYRSGVRDNTYDDEMTKARKGREVYCVITDMWGNSVTTDIAKLIAIPSRELTILAQPTDAFAAMGENYCVTVEAEGDGLTYRWYFRNTGAKEWSKSSVKDNTYDDVMTKARANREVYCVVTDAFGNQLTTDVVTLVLTEQS